MLFSDITLFVMLSLIRPSICLLCLLVHRHCFKMCSADCDTFSSQRSHLSDVLVMPIRTMCDLNIPCPVMNGATLGQLGFSASWASWSGVSLHSRIVSFKSSWYIVNFCLWSISLILPLMNAFGTISKSFLVFFLVPTFASWSAISFPSVPTWLRVHGYACVLLGLVCPASTSHPVRVQLNVLNF